jgi:hypothetical protein
MDGARRRRVARPPGPPKPEQSGLGLEVHPPKKAHPRGPRDLGEVGAEGDDLHRYHVARPYDRLPAV